MRAAVVLSTEICVHTYLRAKCASRAHSSIAICAASYEFFLHMHVAALQGKGGTHTLLFERESVFGLHEERGGAFEPTGKGAEGGKRVAETWVTTTGPRQPRASSSTCGPS